MTEQEIINLLSEVHHPGQGDKSIVELEMIDKVEVQGDKVIVTLGFPRRRDPLTEYLVGATRAVLIRNLPQNFISEVKAEVKEEPKPKKKGLDLDNSQLEEVRHIIGIASGKGGVGKSTVAVNLACALARLGYRVGLADADVYGPSVPVMTGTEDAQPSVVEIDGKEYILPIEKYGVKWMSIGYFAQKDQALIWRGPMACNALKQMILQVKWEHLDYLLIDMPPGTGDIHISLVQEIPMEGAVIVTTPQDVALSDVVKGVSMFRNESINRPIFGLIENMAWFTPAELPDNRYYIFGKDGGVEMARRLDLNLLGQIPLVQGIRECGDQGVPAALGDGPEGKAFTQLAEKLSKVVDK